MKTILAIGFILLFVVLCLDGRAQQLKQNK